MTDPLVRLPGSLDEQDTRQPIPDSEFIGPEPESGGTVPVPSAGYARPDLRSEMRKTEAELRAGVEAFTEDGGL